MKKVTKEQVEKAYTEVQALYTKLKKEYETGRESSNWKARYAAADAYDAAGDKYLKLKEAYEAQ
jgi:hypothetical protein